jgi:ASC-1-like (ASCH) protein
MEIEKKATKEYFQLIKSGKKKFDVRLADWECKKGDTLILKEWDSKKKEYTKREIRKKVGFVLKTKDLNFFSNSDIEKYGFQVISLE